MEYMFVSVIIPTYRDWDRLALCVEALSKQSYPRHCFEVVIINNDPNHPAPPQFTLPEHFKIITETKPGSYAARNAALEIVKGEIIGFTDSDCIPDKDWITNAITYFKQHPTCSRIAGNVSIFPNGPRPTTTDLYNSVFEFPQVIYSKYFGTGVTANLFTYKKVFDSVGPFNEKLFSLGDLEWGKLAHSAGFQIHYVESVVVKHPSRSLADLIIKVKRIGGAQGQSRNRNAFQSLLSCIADVSPKLYIIKQIYRYGAHMNLFEKTKVLLLRHYLLYVRAAEKFRVLQGKQPERL